ncbi:DUF2637 domain-containing protein [Sphaerisporangium aureirubrum]|uniref:DUF2637 domain-containing protein n=1 Tax=Sphaerisporangium aureirubrum TaxID=1544736 RepID=A0ABW1NA36_9ACTN
MDVTPPLTAVPATRRPEPSPAPATAVPAPQPSRIALALRRLGTSVAVLAVAGLAGAACTLSFEPLRALAMTGGARGDLAYLYPAGFSALLAVALISVFLLRSRRWPARVQAGFVLAVLVVAAATANTVVATGATINPREAAVTVAVLPWALLVLGLWLLLLSVRAPQIADLGPGDEDLVPFGGDRTAPVAADPVIEVRDPVQAPPLEEPVTAQEREEAARHLPEAEPVVGPTPAPETPTVDQLPPPRDESPLVVDEPEWRDRAGKDETLVPEPRGGREPDLPLRWGDLMRPASGDVLVHPLPGVAEPEAGGGTQPYPAFTGDDEYDPGLYVERGDEADAGPATEEPVGVEVDTQPYPSLREDSARLPAGEQDPDPAHGAWVADPEEVASPQDAPRRPAYSEETAAPPSGRMRSTPLPPEE